MFGTALLHHYIVFKPCDGFFPKTNSIGTGVSIVSLSRLEMHTAHNPNAPANSSEQTHVVLVRLFYINNKYIVLSIYVNI